MAKKDNPYRGVFTRKTDSREVRHGIDYIHPMTGERIRKIISGAKSQEVAISWQLARNAGVRSTESQPNNDLDSAEKGWYNI